MKMKKILGLALAAVMTVSMTAFGASVETIELDEETTEAAADAAEETAEAAGDYHIGIVTGSVS